MLNIRQNYPLSVSDFGLVPEGPFFFLSRYSRCHVETGDLGSNMAAASQKEPSPSVLASPFQAENKMAMQQPFCLLRDGREKGREGRRRPEGACGKDEEGREGEGRASIRQEPKKLCSDARAHPPFLPPGLSDPVQPHGRTDAEGWTRGSAFPANLGWLSSSCASGRGSRSLPRAWLAPLSCPWPPPSLRV